jgi:hypothetical protein
MVYTDFSKTDPVTMAMNNDVNPTESKPESKPPAFTETDEPKNANLVSG